MIKPGQQYLIVNNTLKSYFPPLSRVIISEVMGNLVEIYKPFRGLYFESKLRFEKGIKNQDIKLI